MISAQLIKLKIPPCLFRFTCTVTVMFV